MPSSSGAASPSLDRAWGWWVLAGLLGALTLAVVTFDRSTWPSMVGDEATYVMQAQSLAFARDLYYDRGDYDRFVATFDRVPEGLILQSGDGGATITYGKPIFYALYLAPFVRVAPVQGFVFANLLAVVLAAVMVSRALMPVLGHLAPLCVAVWIFASVAFAYTFWIHPDLLLMCTTAVAYALVFGRRPAEEPGNRPLSWVRWALAGGLLAAVIFSRPLYLPLVLPAVLAVPRAQRVRGLAALGLGALLVAGGAAAAHQALSGSWTGYGGERRGFYSYTGFPEVQFPAAAWREAIEDWGDHSVGTARETVAGIKVDPLLSFWNTIYFLVGRHTGVLPYFLPLVLGFFAPPRGGARWSLLVAVVVITLAFLWFRAFNYYGGGGAIANRYFLPIYPALWFVASGPLRVRWLVAVTAGAALFLGNLWLAPRSFPFTADETYRYVGEVAQRWLPYETTQGHLKPAAREDVIHHGLWVKVLDRSLRPEQDGTRFYLQPDRKGRLVIGSPRPLAAVELTFGVPPPLRPEIRGGRARALGETEGQQRWRVELGRGRTHPMWWTWERWHLYILELRMDGAPSEVPLMLAPEPPEPHSPAHSSTS